MAGQRGKTFKLTDAVGGSMKIDMRVPHINPDGYWGEIPEPSQQQVNAWRAGLTKLGEEFGFTGDPNDYEALAEFAANLEAEDFDAQDERQAELYAAVCSDMPNVEQIMACPPRYRQAFYGYVAGQLSPEASKPAGKS